MEEFSDFENIRSQKHLLTQTVNRKRETYYCLGDKSVYNSSEIFIDIQAGPQMRMVRDLISMYAVYNTLHDIIRA